YYRERVLEPGPYANENFMYLGSGHMMNPNTTLKQEKLGYSDLLSDSVSGDSGIYYIFEEGCCDPGSALFSYLGAVPERTDTFRAGGHTFEVYRLRAG
ncbi:MAG: hypothetical protein K6E33_08345, partial [Lachnospiraceae bacterium]|nr:hypothetical protein [Lachnospiraceae bacterium]